MLLSVLLQDIGAYGKCIMLLESNKDAAQVLSPLAIYAWLLVSRYACFAGLSGAL